MSEHQEIRELCELTQAGQHEAAMYGPAFLARKVLEILDRADPHCHKCNGLISLHDSENRCDADGTSDPRCCCKKHAAEVPHGCILCIVHAPAHRRQRSAICPACGYHRGTVRPYCPECMPGAPTLRE